MQRSLITTIFAISVIMTSESHATTPSLINYQGLLTNPAGTPQVGTFTVTFTIYPVSAGGSPEWSEAQSVTTDSEGRFNVLLGTGTPLTDAVFSGSDRYLSTAVFPDGEMVPRTRITSVAYAHRISTVDGASGGSISSSVSIGPGITNSGTNSLAVGQFHNNTANTATIAGGSSNTISGLSGFIGGGSTNSVSGNASVVGGGDGNAASGAISSVLGGQFNEATGFYSAIGGGSQHDASGEYSFVGGGFGNRARGDFSTIGGGGGYLTEDSNAAVGNWTSIVGGRMNLTTSGGQYASIGGGQGNTTTHSHCVVGGGEFNSALANGATIAGGSFNSISGPFASVGGGAENRAGVLYSAIPGGLRDTALGVAVAIGGGANNVAAGWYSTIPGGLNNRTTGEASFAAGRDAHALHDSTFVWGSGGGVFASTSRNQFLVDAPAGLGVNTNAPYEDLTIVEDGSIGFKNGTSSMLYMYESGINNGDRHVISHSPAFPWYGLMYRDGADEFVFRGNVDDIMVVELSGASGRVGINTAAPSEALHVVGDICATGTIGACSDARFKENILPLGNALGLVEQLRGVRYDWKTKEFPDHQFSSDPQIGLIAQDVREVVPEAVSQGTDGYYSIDYARLVTVLIEGMKEQQREIESLKKRMDLLTQ